MINKLPLLTAIIESIITLLIFLPWAIIYQMYYIKLNNQTCNNNNMMWIYCMLIYYWLTIILAILLIPLRYKTLSNNNVDNSDIDYGNMTLAYFKGIYFYLIIGQFIMLVAFVVWLGILLRIDINGCSPMRLLFEIFFFVNLVLIGVIILSSGIFFLCCCMTKDKSITTTSTNALYKNIDDDIESRQKRLNYQFENLPDEVRPLNGTAPYFGPDPGFSDIYENSSTSTSSNNNRNGMITPSRNKAISIDFTNIQCELSNITK